MNNTKRYGFVFSQEVDELIQRLSEETGMKYVTLVERALKLFAEKYDQKNGK